MSTEFTNPAGASWADIMDDELPIDYASLQMPKSPAKKTSPLKKVCTAACKAVMDERTCKFKRKCNYAHSADQLHVPKCKHGAECGDKSAPFDPKCMWLHEGETKETYLERTGLAVKFALYFERTQYDTDDEEDEMAAPARKRMVMCKSLSRNEECIYGKSCGFLHCKSEVRPFKCRKPCCSDAKCQLIHQKESIDVFLARLGIEFSEPVRAPTPVTRPAPRAKSPPVRADAPAKACREGERCQRVALTKSGVYNNLPKSNQRCGFIHPGETMQNYRRRNGK